MTQLLPPPMLGFAAGSGQVVANLDALLGSGLFVEGVTRSGKTNLIRVLLEQTYGMVQHIVLDPEGEYASVRSADRPYIIVGKGRDVELPADAEAVKRFVLAIIAKGVSMIVDLSEYDEEDQQTLVGAVCDAIVSLPQDYPGNALIIIEELQEFAAQGGGRETALRPIRRLAKRGLKRGFAIVGGSQRVSDVSKGVVTMLKSKAIGGTDMDDVKRALLALGMPTSMRSEIADLQKGQFFVKGPAFERHAQLVCAPLSVSAPPPRRRGEPPAPAPEAPAEIAALAAALAASVAEEQRKREEEAAAETARRNARSTVLDDEDEDDYEGGVDLAELRATVDAAVRAARAPFFAERTTTIATVESAVARVEQLRATTVSLTATVGGLMASLDGLLISLKDSSVVVDTGNRIIHDPDLAGATA